jgi:hypothetical protein
VEVTPTIYFFGLVEIAAGIVSSARRAIEDRYEQDRDLI